MAVIEVGSRRRAQPPPPHVVAESLRRPDLDPARPWLRLRSDEQPPQVLTAEPGRVVWSSLWPNRPDAIVRFDLESDGSGGTLLRWTLLVDEPAPDAPQLGHLRRRLNQLINAELRYSYGQ